MGAGRGATGESRHGALAAGAAPDPVAAMRRIQWPPSPDCADKPVDDKPEYLIIGSQNIFVTA